MALIEIFEYRANFYWAIGSITVSNLMIYLFWVAVLGSGYAQSDYTAPSIGLYFLIIVLVGQITNFSSWGVANSIKEGDIATALVKPYNYAGMTLATTSDDRFFKSLVTVIVVSIIISISHMQVRLEQLPFFIVSVLIAAACKFFLGMAMGSLAFWFSRVNGFNSLFWNIGGLFSGEMIPPEFLPSILSTISRFLPFSYLAYFPTKLLTQKVTFQEFALGASIQLIWFSIFYLFYRVIWSRGIRHLEAVGT